MSELHKCFACLEKSVEFSHDDMDRDEVMHAVYVCTSCGTTYELTAFEDLSSDNDSDGCVQNMD